LSNAKRLTRINEEIMREVSEIIRSEIKDPRVDTIITCTKAEITNDFKLCRLHVSIMGEESHKSEVVKGLNSSKGFIRKMLAERINLRVTPELYFEIDDSLDYGYKIDALLKRAAGNGA